MIELRNVQVKIQNRIILDAINIVFSSDNNYWINGRNGSGKTILLRIISGQLQPYSGSVSYDFIDDNLDWDSKYALRKQFIHVIPTQALHSLLKGQDIYYQQRYYSIEEDTEQTVRNYLGNHLDLLKQFKFPASLQIKNLLDLEITRLSNGQLKKIIILRKLLESIPKVLLLDYPFEGLDAISRAELGEFLDHLSIEYQVQLIIVDHERTYLPKSVNKKVDMSSEGISISDLDRNSIDESVQPLPINQTHIGDGIPVVEMQKVKIQYGSKVIIKELNWRVNKGERWALTGRNGSGKTTLFSLIFADHPMAYSEQVFLFGKRRGTGESIWDIKKRISYLGPEQIHFLDHHVENLTVFEYLKRSNQENLKSLIEYFSIEKLLPFGLKQLSNGQLQLVMLVSLFLEKKELLLRDEPFQFLDFHQKARVSYFLESLLDDDTTLILITHFEGDVARWTDKRLRL